MPVAVFWPSSNTPNGAVSGQSVLYKFLLDLLQRAQIRAASRGLAPSCRPSRASELSEDSGIFCNKHFFIKFLSCTIPFSCPLKQAFALQRECHFSSHTSPQRVKGSPEFMIPHVSLCSCKPAGALDSG